MKTNQPLSADRRQLISQILGVGRGQYFDVPAPTRRPRAGAGSLAKAVGQPGISFTDKPAKA